MQDLWWFSVHNLEAVSKTWILDIQIEKMQPCYAAKAHLLFILNLWSFYLNQEFWLCYLYREELWKISA